MAGTGSASVNFGAFPGASDAQVVITGQAGIVNGSLVEAWILPAATADHTKDEHIVETLEVVATDIVAATGFTIKAFNTSQLNEPLIKRTGNASDPLIGGRGTRLWGIFNVGWVWN